MPRASIIIPTRNRRDLLEQTLASVLAQSEADFEAIVVDDGSTDGTLGWLRAAAREDERIRVLRRAGASHGACAARNQGLAAARADVIIFLDSDDILEPFALEDRLKALDEHAGDIDFLVTQARCFHRIPGDLDTLWNIDPPGITPGEDLHRFLRRDIPWQTTGATWRRWALARLAGWDEHAPSGQDYELHVRAILLGLRYHRLPIYDFHWRKGSADRASVGLASIQAQHWAYRAVMAERFLTMMRKTRQLTALRRDLLAGQFWMAAENVRQRSTIRAATRIWDRARVLGLIDTRRWIEGSAYLIGFGRRPIREPARRWIERTWPGELLLKPSPTHTLAPIPQEWEARVQQRRADVSQEPAHIAPKSAKQPRKRRR